MFGRNFVGPSLKSKIIVLESDDWGSDRFPNKATRDRYIANGYPIENCWMSHNDTFESNKDVESLVNVLDDHLGNPKITFLFNPANPDFEKIVKGKFATYYYESFRQRVERVSDSGKLINLYKEAIEETKIEMAFHGREHLYTERWLRDLRTGDKVLREGFKNRFWGFSKSYYPSLKHSFRPAFALDKQSDLKSQRAAILEGIQIMEEVFGKKVRYFLAPNGPFSLSLLEQLSRSGVDYIGLAKKFKDAETGKISFQWLGKKIDGNLRVITRNASFEPGSPRHTDWVDACLCDIKNAFFWRKPAVISSHRANYVGGLSEKNRDRGLRELGRLLFEIIKRWPDVQFMTSSQLGDLLSKKGS